MVMALPLVAAAGSAAPVADANTWFIEARYQDPAQLQALGSQFQHLIVDRRARTVRVEANDDDIAALRAAGLSVAVDKAATAQLRAFDQALRSPLGLKSIPGYACYRTVEETYTTMDTLATQYPRLAAVSEIGPSWERSRDASRGYAMKVWKLWNRDTDALYPDKPSMVVLGSIHAREYTPAELLTRFGEWLVTGYGTDPEATWLMDHYKFHLVLQANPDGRKKAEAGSSWRKNTNNTNGSCGSSSYGVDLNRNFPFHWNTVPGGSSPDACVETYHGPTAASEPETRNIVAYVAGTPGSGNVYSGGVFPDLRGDASSSAAPDTYRGLFMDIHSYSQLVLWPWGDTSTAAPNQVALRTLGRRLAYFNNYSPEQSSELYATDGATDDNMYGLLGVPAYTIELGVAFFESCTTFQNTTLPRNLAAVRYAARNLEAPYKLPAGPDTTSVTISSASVPAGTAVTVTATVDDSHFNQTNGTETTQAIASARAYVDKLPWEAGATAIAMTAVDGSFNSTAESVRASIDTSALAPGAHLIYVQGTDAAGKPGTPNAVKLTVTAGGNIAPVANFSVVTNGLTASFTDSSTDSDGTIASRAWTFGDGGTASTANPQRTYATAGTYTVTLTVTDNAGATNQTSKTVTVSTGVTVLQVNAAVNNLSGAASSEQLFALDVPGNATNLRFFTSGGTGDADLYVKFGAAPTTTTYDCKSEASTSTENCAIATAQLGRYYVLLRGYSAFSGVSLTGSYAVVDGARKFENLTDVAIADNTTVESSIVVSGISGNAPAALQVGVKIVHTYIGDLKVDLIAPNGTVYVLHNRAGGGTDNIDRTFTVNASAVLANGTWRLRVNDNAPGDTGRIDAWSLQF